MKQLLVILALSASMWAQAHTLPLGNGGTAATTQQGAFDNLAPTCSVAGCIAYWNGTHWVKLDGNTSGTNWLQQTASGVPSWTTPTGSLPSQTSQGGNVLTTNGSSAAWASGLPVYTPHQLGLLANGTNEGAAIQTALNNLSTAGGGIVQLQAGDTLNAGTTVIDWPLKVWMRGTGMEGSGQWDNFPVANAYFQVGCAVDPYGCITMNKVGPGGMSDLALHNSTTCATFIHQTQMLVTLDRVSLTGKNGSLSTNDACNDGIQLGANVNHCSGPFAGSDCYFAGYGSQYNIYPIRVRRAMIYNTAAAFTQAYVHASGIDSNSSADASLVAGTCNDAGNKCGLSSLACSTSDVITLSSFNGTGTGATATVACTGTNAIANGTKLTVTARGFGFNAPITSAATATCPGGDTCTAPAAVSTLILGPFIELLGYSGGGTNALQNHLIVDGEFGSAASNTNPGDAHYNSIVYGDYATNNQVVGVGDDSATLASGYNSLAVFHMSANSQHNDFQCMYYQASFVSCASDANSGSYANHYLDAPRSIESIQTFRGAHLGSSGFPFNDGNIAVALRAGTGVTDQAGKQAASGGTMTYGFTGTYTNAPVCVVQDSTTITNLLTVSVTSSALTVTTTGATDSVSWNCWTKG